MEYDAAIVSEAVRGGDFYVCHVPVHVRLHYRQLTFNSLTTPYPTTYSPDYKSTEPPLQGHIFMPPNLEESTQMLPWPFRVFVVEFNHPNRK